MNIPELDKFRPSDFSPKQVKKKYPEFYSWLLENYSFVEDFREKLYCWWHKLDSRPVCKMCGRPVSFVTFSSGYNRYCSGKCGNSDPDTLAMKERNSMEKYGVSSPNKLKSSRDKARATFKKNYGDNPEKLEELNERKHITCQERYGVDVFFQSEEFKEKYKKTMNKRYGVDNYSQTKEHKYKAKQTSLRKYGYEHWYQNPENLEEMRKRNLAERGVEWNIMLVDAENTSCSDTKPNIEFAKKLEENGVSFEREFPIINKRYDFKMGDTLIEINPSITHNCNFGVFGGKPKTPEYHQEKTLLALEHGYRCITVWDWDNLDLIIEMLKEKEKVYARDCEVVEVSKKDSDSFLEANHLQGTCRGQSIRLGLTYNGELIEIMSFGKQRLRKPSKENSYELLRLCTKTGYAVTGGAERLFKRFLELYSPDSIVSYCDLSKFSGDIYTRLGFTKKRLPKPSKHWFNLKTGQRITDNLLRQRGFDQLFKTNYGKGTSNEELMLEHGFVEIYDCGQQAYEWNS